MAWLVIMRVRPPPVNERFCPRFRRLPRGASNNPDRIGLHQAGPQSSPLQGMGTAREDRKRRINRDFYIKPMMTGFTEMASRMTTAGHSNQAGKISAAWPAIAVADTPCIT